MYISSVVNYPLKLLRVRRHRFLPNSQIFGNPNTIVVPLEDPSTKYKIERDRNDLLTFSLNSQFEQYLTDEVVTKKNDVIIDCGRKTWRPCEENRMRSRHQYNLYNVLMKSSLHGQAGLISREQMLPEISLLFFGYNWTMPHYVVVVKAR